MDKLPHHRANLQIYQDKFKIIQICILNVEVSQHGYLTSEAQDLLGTYEKTAPNYCRSYVRMQQYPSTLPLTYKSLFPHECLVFFLVHGPFNDIKRMLVKENM